MTRLSSIFSEKGFTCMEIDLSNPPFNDGDAASVSSEDLMNHFENGMSARLKSLLKYSDVVNTLSIIHSTPFGAQELASHLRFATAMPSPFPPVIFSRSNGALIAQTYISSHPASGLILISPPPSNLSVAKALLPTPLEEFNYEVKFPVAIVGTKEEVERVTEGGRLGTEDIDVLEVVSVDGQDAFTKMEELLDEWGI
ncbi:hypothetical protein EW146_g4442 [Bondarzewia mesenterica]|uniref:Uncharacterized protein n=1 Tax=Bondarzewia mesenterica TaxID=1095465 RepID=A0A4V6S1G5_9AGAM|nr:hypothetical protein EW146_g4442 [Bondarzewia mesenterica]